MEGRVAKVETVESFGATGRYALFFEGWYLVVGGHGGDGGLFVAGRVRVLCCGGEDEERAQVFGGLDRKGGTGGG